MQHKLDNSSLLSLRRVTCGFKQAGQITRKILLLPEWLDERKEDKWIHFINILPTKRQDKYSRFSLSYFLTNKPKFLHKWIANKLVLAGRTGVQTLAASTSLLWCTVASPFLMFSCDKYIFLHHQILISYFLLKTSILVSTSTTVLSSPVALLLFQAAYLGHRPPEPSTQSPPGRAPLSPPVGVIHSPLCFWCLLCSAELGIICSQPPQPSAAAKGPAQLCQDNHICPHSFSYVHSGGPPVQTLRYWPLRGGA